MDAHLQAAEVHDAAAKTFARLGDCVRSARESDLAASQRRTHADELALHPEWARRSSERGGLVSTLTVGGRLATIPAR
jgi:hypothetical protein